MKRTGRTCAPFGQRGSKRVSRQRRRYSGAGIRVSRLPRAGHRHRKGRRDRRRTAVFPTPACGLRGFVTDLCPCQTRKKPPFGGLFFENIGRWTPLRGYSSRKRGRLLSKSLDVSRRRFAKQKRDFAHAGLRPAWFCHGLLPLPTQKGGLSRLALAGAEGFEPTTLGFGDQYSTS